MWPKTPYFFLTFLLSAPLFGLTPQSLQMSNELTRGILLSHKGEVISQNKNSARLLQTGDPIYTDDDILTSDSSMAVIFMKSNSVLIIGAQARLTVGQHGPDQLQHIHIHQGKVRIQKKVNQKEMLHGSVITLTQDPHIYQAKEFEVALTDKERSLTLLRGQLIKLAQSKLQLKQKNEKVKDL